MNRSYVSRAVMKGLLLILILSFNIAPNVSANINENKVPKGFQRLSDVTMFNGTDIFPENIIDNAIIPNGFFVPSIFCRYIWSSP